MTLISIREQPNGPDGSNATLSFDGEGVYPITVTPPFSDEEEARLEWYFEQHLQFPFTQQVRARNAAASIASYGEALFTQVFANPQAFADYKAALHANPSALRFEIAGSPEFQRLHWEALRDPSMPRAFALDAPMVRKNLKPQVLKSSVRPSPTINILVVTARPGGARDVGYRTISRPLVEALEQANVRAQVDIVRPGSYRELARRLEAARLAVPEGAPAGGYYHVVHFDVHGAVLSYDELERERDANRFLFQARYGRGDIAPYEGRKAFLFLEGEQAGQYDPVEAGELADLLITQQVPIAMLNACQSGKQVGASETSLGSRLMQAGVQVVLAMGYSVTVTAAALLMRTLYAELLAGRELAAAIRLGRRELWNQKGRRAYFNQSIDLEDWLLPVVYQNRTVELQPRAFTPEESAAFYTRKAQRYNPPAPAYGFFGRDLDILQIERRILAQRNILLLRGMGGAGKTTLLRHLAAWWQRTGLIERVWSFEYDQRAWTRQQIMDAIARELYPPSEYHGVFQPLGLEAQQAMLADTLRARRHLLILDNLESITGAELAIQHTLPEPERAALHGLLRALAGGQTLVLLGSRSDEPWLAAGTFGSNVYELPGLDPEAATALADAILTQAGVSAAERASDELRRIMKLLNGYPLALDVVLNNLARQPAAAVLDALQKGDVALDTGDAQDKTSSILRCIDYSHSNIAPGAQALLSCLAPFTSVINQNWLPQYSEQLRAQPALAGLPLDEWDAVLAEAQRWGLLKPHAAKGYLEIQPVLPFFLRSRLNDPAQAELRAAIDTAFRAYYNEIGGELDQLAASKRPQQRQLGLALIELEYENLSAALRLVLAAQSSIFNISSPLSLYLDNIRDHARGLALGEQVLAGLEHYPAAMLIGKLGLEFAGVVDNVAKRQLALKRYTEAERSYQKALGILLNNTVIDKQLQKRGSAGIYHQLSLIAHEQRQWTLAEQYCQQALHIFIEYRDEYNQAKTYFQLGHTAQKQYQWIQAEEYYQLALGVFKEFGDVPSQALIYHNLGTIMHGTEQRTHAEEYYKQSLELKNNIGDQYGQAGTYHQLGRIAIDHRELTQAEYYFQQALTILIEFNDIYEQARNYHELGVVAQEQHQLAQAEQYYHQALRIYVEFGDRYSQASTYHQLGWVAQEQRQWAQAREYFLNDLAITASYDDPHGLGITLRSLARLWQASGDATLPAAVAEIIGGTAAEVEEQFRAFGAGDGG